MDWKKKTVLIYTIGGLLIGLLSGIITVNNAVEKDKEINLTVKDGARMAIDVMKKTILK